MLFFVFDNEFNKLGIIDNANDVVWERNLYKLNNFEMKLVPSDTQFSVLNLGNIIVKQDNLEECMVITEKNITLNEDGFEEITLKGFGYEYYFSNRITGLSEKYKDYPSAVMRSLVYDNCIYPFISNRYLPNLRLGTDVVRSYDISFTTHLKVLSDELYDICRTHELGFRVKFNYIDKRYEFDVFKGVDRTKMQVANSQVIFANEFDNITNQSFLTSETDFKTTALVYGEGGGKDRYSLLVNNDAVGYNRLETMVDARDLQQTQDDILIPLDEYKEQLTERGLSKLSNFQKELDFNFDLITTESFVYKKDFDLGDKVTVLNRRWGLELHERIVSIKEIYDDKGFNIQMIVGNTKPTLVQILKEKIK